MPNKRSRAARVSSSDSDRDFTSFVYQNQMDPPVLSGITRSPSTQTRVKDFWNNPLSLTYSPTQGESLDWSNPTSDPDAAINSQTSQIDLVSSQIDRNATTHLFDNDTPSHSRHTDPSVHITQDVPNPSSPMQVDARANTATRAVPDPLYGHPYRPTSPVNAILSTPLLGHHAPANPLLTDLQLNRESQDLDLALLDKLKITVNSCDIGISDRVSRSIILQANPINDILMEALENPLPSAAAGAPPLNPPVPTQAGAASVPTTGGSANPLAPPSPVGVLAAAQILNAPGPQQENVPRQAYYTRILPQSLDIWRPFLNASQKAAASRIRAAFIRDMANKRRYPYWAVGITPPSGIITTPIGAIKLVNVRRQTATSGMHTLASILDDRAADHNTTADSHLQGLKRHYEQQPPTPERPTYRFDSAVELSKRLVERASAILNQKLYDESARLKICPDAALWVGIPMALVPANIKAVNHQPPNNPPQSRPPSNRATSNSAAGRPPAPTTNMNMGNTMQNPVALPPSAPLHDAPDALFSDVVQINAPIRPGQGLNYVSPLEAIPQNDSQVFSTSWGKSARNPQPSRKQPRRGQGLRGNPYQRENLEPTRPPPLMESAPFTQNPQAVQQSAPRGNRRRRGMRTNNPNESHQNVNLSNQQIGFLQNLLKDLGR